MVLELHRALCLTSSQASGHHRGAHSLSRIKKVWTTERRGMALTGLILGYISLFCPDHAAIVFPTCFAPRFQPTNSAARATARDQHTQITYSTTYPEQGYAAIWRHWGAIAPAEAPLSTPVC